MRHEHQNQHHQGNHIARPNQFFQKLIIQRSGRHANAETQPAPYELHHQIVRTLRGGHRRTVKHDHPQPQQGGNAKSQSCDGDFHLTCSKQTPAAWRPHLLAGCRFRSHRRRSCLGCRCWCDRSHGSGLRRNFQFLAHFDARRGKVVFGLNRLHGRAVELGNFP